MKQERIFLDPSDERVYIDAYLPDLRREGMPAILVIPGGGYSCVCTEREGEPIALAFLALGYAAFVLNYRVGRKEDVYPKQLLDASRAILRIRADAAAFSVDPARVYAVGFSAGGHLCGSLACCYDDVTEALGIARGENRPTAVALGYPVVTLTAKTHQNSFVRLLDRPDGVFSPEEVKRFSLDERVRADSAPMFLWHTAEDRVVPVDGTLLLARSLADAGVPCRLEIYPFGPHGCALGNEITACGQAAYLQPAVVGWCARADYFFRSLL